MVRRMSGHSEKPIFLRLMYMGLFSKSFHFGLISSSIRLLFLLTFILCTDGYNPLDPEGNVTIKWDILQWNQDKYEARVSIYNYQLFRNIEAPGWKLSWSWLKDEIIWHMNGAEAVDQGNCTRVKGADTLPHSCMKTPTIIDLLPGVPYNMQTTNCCKGGVLSSPLVEPSTYGASFQMTVGMVAYNNLDEAKPENFTLGIPGYTCSNAIDVPATRFTTNGRRVTRALSTWNVTCTYSAFRASLSPTCCVSLSAFYQESITACPRCSCGCRGIQASKCFDNRESFLSLPSTNKEINGSVVRCTRHMCPVRIHWHVKQSYKKYWRVKMTIENFSFLKNYSMWTMALQHPNLRSINQIFSFEYQDLNQFPVNDTGVFWGVKYYNEMLIQEGNVQSEMLMTKERGIFTFDEGWAFPRKILFNGDECVMPLPDEFPRLPGNAANTQYSSQLMMVSLLALLTSIILG